MAFLNRRRKQLPADSSGKPSQEQVYTCDNLRKGKLDEGQVTSCFLKNVNKNLKTEETNSKTIPKWSHIGQHSNGSI